MGFAKPKAPPMPVVAPQPTAEERAAQARAARTPDPPPPVEPASASDEDISRRAQMAANELRQRRGRASTILTGGGDGGPVSLSIPGLSGGNRQTMG